MRKISLSLLVISICLFLSPVWVLAGNGKGVMDGTGPALKNKILDGTPFEYRGIVIDCSYGQGLVLSVDENGETVNVVIVGIGPQRYWDLKEMERPEVAEEITVKGYTVTVGNLELNVAFEITSDQGTIELRDPETGLPLWRSPKLKMNKGGCGE